MRARLLLAKQDQLAALEAQLDNLDRTEPRKLFLGNLRHDRNVSRKNVLKAIDKALGDYGMSWNPPRRHF